MANSTRNTKHCSFINKLWELVNDPTKDDAICWANSGESFVLYHYNPLRWNKLLLTYFKHNNMSSFIRQLNMYGFHKIASEDCTVESGRSQARFFHPNFQKGHPELLPNIIRKAGASTKVISKKENASEASVSVPTTQVKEFNKVLSDVSVLRGRQEAVDQQLATIKNENAALWHELTVLRNKHNKQSQIVNKLIQFLLTLVQPNTRMGGLVKRKYPLMIDDSPAKVRRTKSNGPTIHELNSDTHTDDAFDTEYASGVDSQANFHVQSPKNSPQANDFIEEVPSDEQLVELLTETPDGTKVAENDNDVNVDELLNMNVNASTDEDNINDLNDLITEQQMEMATNSADNGLNNLIAGKYNTNVLTGKGKGKTGPEYDNGSDPSLAVAPIKPPELKRLNSLHEFNNHVAHTQGELDSIKDLLTGNNVDATQLLGLFNGEFQIPNPDPFGTSELSCYSDYYPIDSQQPLTNMISDAIVSSGPFGTSELSFYSDHYPVDSQQPPVDSQQSLTNINSDVLLSSDPVMANPETVDTSYLQQLFDEEDTSPLPSDTLLEGLDDETYNECPSLETPQVELQNKEFSYATPSTKN